jgi:hypothetical protein
VRARLIGVTSLATALVLLGPAASGATASQSSSRLGRPGTELGDGFRVAAGTRLVGAVFPKIEREESDPTGWRAVLVVKSDALTALNRYAAQAAAQGYRQVSNPAPHCWSPNHGQVFCKGFSVYESAFLAISVHVCRSCPQPVSEALLDYTNGYLGSAEGLEPIAPPVGLPSGGLPPPSTPTEQLTGQQYARMLKHPADEEAIPRFAAVSGSRLLAPATIFAECPYESVAVVDVTSDPRRVFSAYASGTPVRARVGRVRVTTAGDASANTTLVERAEHGRPVLLSYACNE